MVGPDCLKILRILNKQEAEYISRIKKSKGEEKAFNINGVLIIREAKRRIIKELAYQNEPEKPKSGWFGKFWLF